MNEANPSSTDPNGHDLVTEILKHIREHGEFVTWLRRAAHYHRDESNAGALAGDILYGADQIAEFLYGDKRQRRKIYRLVDSAQRYHLEGFPRFPHFRLGASICSRKSTLLKWVAQQEANGPRE